MQTSLVHDLTSATSRLLLMAMTTEFPKSFGLERTANSTAPCFSNQPQLNTTTSLECHLSGLSTLSSITTTTWSALETRSETLELKSLAKELQDQNRHGTFQDKKMRQLLCHRLPFQLTTRLSKMIQTPSQPLIHKKTLTLYHQL